MSLSSVGIVTLTGAQYLFPDVDRDVLRLQLPKYSDLEYSQLVLANASGAALTLPFRIVKRVIVDGEDLWVRAGSPA